MSSVTFEDVSLSDFTLEQLPRLKRLRERHFKHMRLRPAICTELPLLITQYLRDLDQKTDPPGVRAGKLYKYVLTNKTAVITDDNLLAGTTSTKPIGVMLYPDLYCLSLWPELETMADRPKNPFKISKEEIDILNLEVFPFWLDRTVMEVIRKDHGNPLCQRLFERLVFYLVSKPETISHTIPDYGVVVKRGLADLRQDARNFAAATNDQEQQSFYQGMDLALGGIIAYAEKLSNKAEELARRKTDPQRQAELLEIRDICRWVPAKPPRTFWEALNAIWICKIALHQENANLALSLGRLDQILYPFYAKDIENKTMTVAEALDLVGCFWLSIADHVPMIPEAGEEIFGGSGSNQAITLGGVNREDGEDAVNDLTYVMLRVTELLKLRDPNVNARYHYEKNPRKYLERLCQVNLTTLATPCFHNDVSVIDTLKEAYNESYNDPGITEEDARDYGVVGCVEPSSAGRTYGHSGAIFINLTAALEMALFGGKHRLTKGDQINPDPQQNTLPEDMKNWPDFQKALETQIKFLIDQAVTFNDYAGETHQQIHRTPMLSALMGGCMQKGKDVICGGATYNSSGATIIGLAEVVDSVTAIQEFVYDKQKMTWADMLGAINANWEKPYKKFHDYVKKSEEKFGQDSRLAKANADWLMGFLHQNFRGRKNYRGGRYTVGYWSMTNHAGFGFITGALPSGRKDKESFASGITPVSGSAHELTPCLNFVAHLDHRKITNGQALNIKYYPQTTTLTAFADTIEAYFRNGGLQVQFNIIDREILKDAKDHPENYPPMMVRVSGYTAYFQDLNPQMQNEIITRAEYDLATDLEHEYPPLADEGSGLFSRKPFTWKSLVVQLKDLQGRLSEKWDMFTSRRNILRELEGEATEEFVKTLLKLMELVFRLDSDYRKNIQNFTGSYRFRDQEGAKGGDKGVNVFVKFHNGMMEISEDPGPEADVTVTFEKSSTLRDLILAIKTDVLQVILKNQVVVEGNFNYLYKFGFMANHPILPLLKVINKLT